MTVTRGFHRRREPSDRLPPGQYLERGFPVLSAGPTPRTPLERWSLSIAGAIDQERTWSWDELNALEQEDITVDIHCVTTWSKLDTHWGGVSVDTLLDGV
jgi:DMSO/TMAO reductase YedYZ molybdopterin-dependent catalytic subunit